jgi:hypothetical protein
VRVLPLIETLAEEPSAPPEPLMIIWIVKGVPDGILICHSIVDRLAGFWTTIDFMKEQFARTPPSSSGKPNLQPGLQHSIRSFMNVVNRWVVKHVSKLLNLEIHKVL